MKNLVLPLLFHFTYRVFSFVGFCPRILLLVCEGDWDDVFRRFHLFGKDFHFGSFRRNLVVSYHRGSGWVLDLWFQVDQNNPCCNRPNHIGLGFPRCHPHPSYLYGKREWVSYLQHSTTIQPYYQAQTYIKIDRHQGHKTLATPFLV